MIPAFGYALDCLSVHECDIDLGLVGLRLEHDAHVLILYYSALRGVLDCYPDTGDMSIDCTTEIGLRQT